MVNVHLYAELGRAFNNPDDYYGWDGTTKIFKNTFNNSLETVGLGNASRIAGVSIKAAARAKGISATIPFADRRILVKAQKAIDTVGNVQTGVDAIDLGKRAYDLATD
jgi:hypothetical protein